MEAAGQQLRTGVGFETHAHDEGTSFVVLSVLFQKKTPHGVKIIGGQTALAQLAPAAAPAVKGGVEPLGQGAGCLLYTSSPSPTFLIYTIIYTIGCVPGPAQTTPSFKIRIYVFIIRFVVQGVK